MTVKIWNFDSSPATSQTPILESEMSEQQEQDIAELNRHAEYYTIHHPSSDVGMCLHRLLAHVKELEQQRDTALKLAEKILIHQVSPLLRDSEWVMDRMDGKRHVANELRDIFEPKDGK